MTETPVAVLYVGGTGRSGSTVLANVLGEVPGMVSVGELRFLWERGVLENRLCGCGVPFAQCPFWTSVMEKTFGSLDRAELERTARELHAELQTRCRLRRLPRALRSSAPPTSQADPGQQGLFSVLPRLYAAIAEEAGASTIVDSSKLPLYAALLRGMPGLDVRVLHLLRDPRAAAFSWRRRKEQPDRGHAGFMERRGVLKSVTLWAIWNYALERLWRRSPGASARLTYEAFLEAPRRELEGTLSALGQPADLADVFADTHLVRLGVSHTVAGNPARLRHGLVPIQLDDEWKNAMPARDRVVVSALSYPLLRRYGFVRR